MDVNAWFPGYIPKKLRQGEACKLWRRGLATRCCGRFRNRFAVFWKMHSRTKYHFFFGYKLVLSRDA